MSTSRPPPTEEMWEANKETIKRLCFERNETNGRKLTTNEILEQLTLHGLFATRHQLEYRLNLWDYRRNLSGSAWSYIGHRVCKRKQEGKDTDVIVSGVKLPSQEVHRKIKRNQRLLLADKFDNPPSPTTPEGLPISLKTPEALPYSMNISEISPLTTDIPEELTWSISALETPLLDIPSTRPFPWHQFHQDFLKSPLSNFTMELTSLHSLLKSCLGRKRYRRLESTEENYSLSELAAHLSQVMPGPHHEGNMAQLMFLPPGNLTRDGFENVLGVFLFLISNNFHQCCRKEDWDAVKVALRSGIASWLSANSSLHTIGTMSAIMEKLFQYSVFWTAKGDDDSFEIVKWLLTSGQDPDRNGEYHYPDAGINHPLQVAVSSQRLQLARLLLEYGADANKKSSDRYATPLAAACNLRCPNMARAFVELLLLKGARPNRLDHTEDPPELHFAMRRGHIAIAEMLLNYGANICCWCQADDADDVLQHTSTAFSEAAGFKPDSDTPEKVPGRSALSLVQFLLGRSTELRDSNQPQDLDQSLLIPDALVAAASSGNDAVLGFLSARGISMDQENPYYITPLCAASYHGHFATCTLLLQLGVSVTPRSSAVPSALHLAALNGYVDIIKLLAQYDATANTSLDLDLSSDEYARCENIFYPSELESVEEHHKTPLLSAITEGNIKCANQLIKMGVSMSKEELFRILENNNPRLVRAALEAGANPNERNNQGVSALQFSLIKGNLSVIKPLLSRGAQLCGGELAQGFKRGDFKLIQLLLEHGATVHESPFGETFLECALCCQNKDVLSLALKMDPDGYDGGALCAAVFSSAVGGDYRIIETMLDRRPPNAPPDPLEASAISIAVLYGSKYLVHLLTTWLPKTQQCKIPAKRGQEYRHVDCFKKLQWINPSSSITLDTEGLPFWRSSKFITTSPLFAAVRRGDEAIMQRLIELGYQPDLVTISYAIFMESNFLSKLLGILTIIPSVDTTFAEDPAFWAVEVGSASALRLLRYIGQDICKTQAEGFWLERRTVFQYAVEKGIGEVVDVLLEAGADVNEPPSKGSGATALQIAAEMGYITIASRLIALGADVDASSPFGTTALACAAGHGRVDMIRLLLNHCDRTGDNWATNLLEAGASAALRGHYSILDMLRKEEGWNMIQEEKLKMMIENSKLRVDREAEPGGSGINQDQD